MNFRKALVVILVLEAFVATLGILNYGFTLEGLQATTRFSGRLSLLIFSLIFVLHHAKPEALALMMSSSYFLIFATAHGIHLGELLTYVYKSGTQLAPERVAGGFLAYSFIFIMPVLYQRSVTGQISPHRYQVLAWVYFTYVWFIFLMTYMTRILGKVPNAGGTHQEHVFLIVFVLSLWVWKLLANKFAGPTNI